MLYPQTNSKRRALKLDGIWQFKKDTADVGVSENWAAALPQDTIPMPVPAAFNEITEDPELRDYYGVVWYFTTLEKPDDAEVHRLRFGAAVYHAEVFLNGTMLQEAHIGKLPFEVDVSGKLEDGPNLLVVRIDTRLNWQTIPPGQLRPKPCEDCVIEDHQRPEYHFDFLNYGGLLRSVWLLSLPETRLTGLRVETLAEGDRATGWRITAQGKGTDEVRFRIFDREGSVVAEGNASGLDQASELHPESPHTWSPEQPYLYTLEVTLGTHDRYYGWYSDPGHLEVVEKQAGDEPKAWHKEHPDKPIMITEFGADAIAGMHSSPPVMFSEEYQKEMIERYTKALDKLPYLIGEHVWNLCDFMTKQGTQRVFGNRKGIHTRDRQPKLAAHFLRDRWTRGVIKESAKKETESFN